MTEASAPAAAKPANSNSAEHPWPVRSVSTKVADWINRLGSVWVEGQITQINVRPGSGTAWLVLRDPSVDMSLQVKCTPALIKNAPIPLSEGSRVIVFGKLQFFTGRGSISLRITEIRAVGIGELLARIDRLRRLLDAEGLFDPRLKRPLPFLPKRIGLITGRASAAEHDVLEVARTRWSEVEFEIRNCAVQGPTAVPQILEALAELDKDPKVDVIILARGGGSVEDLLPFSDETLCRAICRATTPIVSAIGHEPDNPLSDLVADLRAATPTDAAKRVVPDVVAERDQVAELRERAAQALRAWVQRESRSLDQLRSRPCLDRPLDMLAARQDEIERLIRTAERDVTRLVGDQETTIGHLRRSLAALGPAATLARGYAVVLRHEPGPNHDSTEHVVRSVDDAPAGTELRIRVQDGSIRSEVTSIHSTVIKHTEDTVEK